MKRFATFSLTVALGLGGFSFFAPVQAGMFDMMNPGEWFGRDRDRYYDDYGRYGRGPYGWGGPYGGGYGGPYGWGGPYGGYGPYGWGGGGPYGGYGGYGPGSTIVVTPQGGDKQPAPHLPE